MRQKTKNALSKNEWYHATTLDKAINIHRNGIIVDYNKGNELDFGYGFYLAKDYDKAQNFIVKQLEFEQEITIENSNDKNVIPVVMTFDFNPLRYFEQNRQFNTKIFERYDKEYSEFVFHNRVHNKFGKEHHDYDLIYGGLSDSLPTLLIKKFKLGQISKEETLKSLEKGTSFKQLSIHNQEICDILILKRVTNAFNGEEMDLND